MINKNINDQSRKVDRFYISSEQTIFLKGSLCRSSIQRTKDAYNGYNHKVTWSRRTNTIHEGGTLKANI